MFGIDDAIVGAVGGSLVSGLLNNQGAADRQADAQAFSAQQYAMRYQTQVKDLQAAGLNPMLAYTQGPGNAPSSSAASSSGFPDMGANYLAAKLNSAQVANMEKQGDLIEAQAMDARASAWQKLDQSELIKTQVKEITQKLENQYYVSEVERIKAVAKELQSQYDLNIQKGETEKQARLLMMFQAQKLDAETSLLKLEKDAADTLGNLGRTAGQLKPAVDVLRSLILRK